MLMRTDPFRERDNMVHTLARQRGGVRQVAMPMPMDAYREGDRFIVHFDLPGVDPDSIDLTLERNELTVRAERTWEPTEGQQVLISERPHGQFGRQLFLGEGLDAERMQATYDRGVLTLTIPVSEKAKPRKVEVTAASDGGRTIGADASRAGSATG